MIRCTVCYLTRLHYYQRNDLDLGQPHEHLADAQHTFNAALYPGADYAQSCADEAPANASAQRMSIQRGEKRRWANLRHVNGVAVYQEHAEQSGAGGAFMVSAVVRATPKACFKVSAARQWTRPPALPLACI